MPKQQVQFRKCSAFWLIRPTDLKKATKSGHMTLCGMVLHSCSTAYVLNVSQDVGIGTLALDSAILVLTCATSVNGMYEAVKNTDM